MDVLVLRISHLDRGLGLRLRSQRRLRRKKTTEQKSSSVLMKHWIKSVHLKAVLRNFQKTQKFTKMDLKFLFVSPLAALTPAVLRSPVQFATGSLKEILSPVLVLTQVRLHLLDLIL